MQPRKLRILSAITAGSLTLAVVAAITAGSGSGHTAQPAALAAQTDSFPPVNIDDCPTLHADYPTGGCVAELQKELNLIAGSTIVTVDGTFGPKGSQTYKAVIAFQQAQGLPQDGLVGPNTKKALDHALSGPTPTFPPPTPSQTPSAHVSGVIKMIRTCSLIPSTFLP
jgi:peptidoglycan hydrolase-like protein with peptidoglycan-binding domain